MKRSDALERLQQNPVFDLAVIGGGATGLGVALDAALRGFSVVLLESHDFASGTSSRSTKLLHGGVRYLAQGNVPLVREALAERSAVMHIAPHLAQPLSFVMPSYRWWQTPFYGLGLKLYDCLAGKASLGSTEFLSRTDTLAALPGLQPRGLVGGVKYWDGQFDDARLALALARSAERAGALVLNYMAVQAITTDAGVSTLTAQDQLSAQPHRVRARCVVNATGVWVDQLRARVQAGTAPTTESTTESPAEPPAEVHTLVSASQGVHVVVDRDFMPGQQALLVPKTADGRVLFAVPWLGQLVLGTTDTPRKDAPREPEPFEDELAFILSEASKVLSRPVRRADVRSVWVGLRPLVAQPQSAASGKATKTLSREHTIVVDKGLVTVTGGKWTTYRTMAEDVLRHCFDAGLLPARPAGVSATHVLVGAGQTGSKRVALHQAPGLHLYGDEADTVMQLPGADRLLGMGLTEAMVRFAALHEYAHTVEDVLARRWRMLFLDAQEAERLAPAVAAILQAVHGGDPALEPFVALARRYRLVDSESATHAAAQ